MSYQDFDPFNYIDIKPQNYKFKQNLSSDLEEISKTLENIINDWKEREASLQYIGRIAKGNLGKSDYFIKYFNSKLSSLLEIQLLDLRSSVMKEACRITSLCAKELKLLIEQGITQLLTQNCLFKIAGSANKVISDSASKCILNILRYIHSIKVITNICEIKSMKANNVRVLCAQSLVNIMSFYDTNMIIKSKDILEETIKSLLIDANAEVRATTRKSFILYKSRFEPDAQKIFENLTKNVQKQLLEDEKNFDKLFAKTDFDNRTDNFINSVNKIIDENVNKINQKENISKPKTPEINLFKKKSYGDFSRKDKNSISVNSKETRKSAIKNRKNYLLDNEKEKEKEKIKKEETVKYINMDDDDIVEDDIEEENKGPEDSKEVNMVFNYPNKINKNNAKMSFNKRNQYKDNDNSSFGNNLNNIENISIVNNNTLKIPRDNIPKEKNKSIKSKNLNPFIYNDQEINNNLINELIINKENKAETSFRKSETSSTNNETKISKNISNLKTERTYKFDSNKTIKTKMTSIKQKLKSKENNNNMRKSKEINISPNDDKKAKILKKLNSKFDSINLVNNTINKNKSRHYKAKDDTKFKKNLEKNESNNKMNDIKNISDENNDLIIKSSKTIDYNIKKNHIDISDIEPQENTESTKYLKYIKKDEIETVDIFLDDKNDLEEEIDAVINIDKKKERISTTYNKNEKRPMDNISNKNKNKENKKDNIKSNSFHFSKTNKTLNNNKDKDKKIESNRELYDEINAMSSNINNNNDYTNDELIMNNQNLEEKLNIMIDKLDNLLNQNEKLILFQYLFNYFNMIFIEIKNFSKNTIKRYLDIHIENLKENDSDLVEQVIKNLMRMIFYLKDIFSIYDIELILKILLFSINNSNVKTLKKLSYDLLEIIKKKYDNEELFQSVYSLLGEYNTNYDECYEFMYMLIPSCDTILKNSNYFKQVFRLICLTDINSKKVGRIIDILYRNYRNNFNQAFEEEKPENKKKILMFMEKLNSLYFREFKSNHESIIHIDSSSNYISSINGSTNNQITSSILSPKKINITNLDSDIININKQSLLNNKNSETNISTSQANNNLKSDSNKSNNIIFNQSTKNNNNINTINTNLNGNNIISINNSNNNNIIITNKPLDYNIPNEINQAIINNDLEQYLIYIQKHKSYIPEFVLLLSNKKYSEKKYILTLLNFTQSIINLNDFSIDLNACINLLIKQIKYIFDSNKNDKNIQELIKDILRDMAIFLNTEKCLSLMAKYLTNDTDIETLEILILSLESFCLNYNKKIENINNKKKKPLQNLLDYFITEIFNLLKHQNSEIRKRALFCCIEIYTVIGKEFDNFVTKLPNAQQNLIRLYIKKRVG